MFVSGLNSPEPGTGAKQSVNDNVKIYIVVKIFFIYRLIKSLK